LRRSDDDALRAGAASPGALGIDAPLSTPRHRCTDLEHADRIGIQLIRLIRLFERTSTQLLTGRRDGVDRPGFMLLAHLVKAGPQPSRLLAEAVHSDPSTVSRQTAELIRNGLVERRTDPADGRVGLLSATAGGVELFEDYRRHRNEHLAALLTHWPESDVCRLSELLEQFTADFEAYRTTALGIEHPHDREERRSE
jgi:DNA-binding MarR family transcriptional regulator